MHSRVPTIRVKATDPVQGEFVTINESDFDASKHERFDDVVTDAPPAPEPTAAEVALAALPPPPDVVAAPPVPDAT